MLRVQTAELRYSQKYSAYRLEGYQTQMVTDQFSVLPACKVTVLSDKNWIYYRADYTSRLKSSLSEFDWELAKLDLTSEKTLHLWTLQAGCTVLYKTIAISTYKIIILWMLKSDHSVRA